MFLVVNLCSTLANMKAWFALMFWSTFGHQTSSSACHFSTCKCHCHLWQAWCEVSFFPYLAMPVRCVTENTNLWKHQRAKLQIQSTSHYRFFWRVLCYTANILVVIITSWWVVSFITIQYYYKSIFFVNTTNSYFHYNENKCIELHIHFSACFQLYSVQVCSVVSSQILHPYGYG